MKNVVMTGSFDGVHDGHLHILRVAKQLGDSLYVCVVADRTIEKNKGRPPKYSQGKRIQKVKDTNLPDHVIPLSGDDQDDIDTILGIPPHIYCFGGDQKKQNPDWNQRLEDTLKEKLGSEIKFHTLEPYMRDIYSSTKLQAEGKLLFEYLTEKFEF